MAISQIPGFQPPIDRLFRLANCSFDPDAFRRECEQFATFVPDSFRDDSWRFSLGEGATLVVALETELTGRNPNGWPEYRQLFVSCAFLSICWWETFSKSDHASLESWQRERQEFDWLYADALARTVDVLGPPRIDGADTDEDRHHYAIWRGNTGLLILQQSTFDPQFGLDVNYWIQRWSGPDPQPTSPFIDWLLQLSTNS